ncbi:hypothetical protein R5R35_008062 [Gryllus longicercus]|uniref:Cytochrome P450 n=1 Tax=Gryllus longicercus TaxID=2509291 RepID=A0AAN9VR97_9ORTH
MTSLINQAASLLVSALALPLALWRWGRRRFHMIRLGAKFPGPFAMPIVGNALDPGTIDITAIFNWGYDMLMKYTPLFRYYIGPYLIITSTHPKDNERILSGYKFLNKSHLYNKFLEPWLGDGLLLSHGDKWRSRRKRLTPAFHFKILDQFQSVILNCGNEFVRQLQKRAGGVAFDVWPLVKLLTLDVICETAMGVKMNAQIDRNSKYVNAVEEISDITVKRIIQPWLHIDFIFYLSSLGRKYKKCLEVLHGTTDEVRICFNILPLVLVSFVTSITVSQI